MPAAFMLSERNLGVAVAVVSAAVLATAFALEELVDLPPCPLCIYQRWAHVAAFVLGAAAAATRGGRGTAAVLIALAAAAFLTGAGIAGFHLGVEHGWWSSGEACGGALTNLDITQLQERLRGNLQTPRCDEVRWRLFGVFSLAEMNAAASLAFAVLTSAGLLRIRRQG